MEGRGSPHTRLLVWHSRSIARALYSLAEIRSVVDDTRTLRFRYRLSTPVVIRLQQSDPRPPRPAVLSDVLSGLPFTTRVGWWTGWRDNEKDPSRWARVFANRCRMTRWRRAWDLNPRMTEAINTLAGCPIRPLWQLSVVDVIRESANSQRESSAGEADRVTRIQVEQVDPARVHLERDAIAHLDLVARVHRGNDH